MTEIQMDNKLRLELLGKHISWCTPADDNLTGMVQNITIWKGNVIFQVKLSGTMQRFEYDIPYFLDNTILLNGDTSRRDERNLRWLFKGN